MGYLMKMVVVAVKDFVVVAEKIFDGSNVAAAAVASFNFVDLINIVAVIYN